MKRLWLLVAGLALSLCIPPSAHADDIDADTCSSSDVQTAINSAVDGDRVLVPIGSCTWSTTVTIDGKGITLQGAGIDQTTITDNIAGNAILTFKPRSTHSIIEITQFTLDANLVNKSGVEATINIDSPVAGGSALDSFRIHHNKIINIKNRGFSIFMRGQELGGLIDNNEFVMPAGVNAQTISIFGTGSEDSEPFERPLELGTNKFIFVEDNTFTCVLQPGDGCIDAFAGARYVFRYNTISGCTLGHHGADSGGYRGVHSIEIYENTFNRTAAGNTRALYFRSGTGVVFNNTWTGNYTDPEIANFRSRPQVFDPWGQCDGSSIWDENQPGESGYACLDQVGHIFTENSGGANTLEGTYYWNNFLNGSPTVTGVTAGSGDNHLTEGIDFFSNTQRPSYTPFTYPHPLQGESVGETVSGAVTLSGAVKVQ